MLATRPRRSRAPCVAWDAGADNATARWFNSTATAGEKLSTSTSNRKTTSTPAARHLAQKSRCRSRIKKDVRKHVDSTSAHGSRLGFYSLRHVLRTIADESRDIPAVRHIMGHADSSIDAVYRERISDDRLRAVVEHVRGWLFAGAKTAR